MEKNPMVNEEAARPFTILIHMVVIILFLNIQAIVLFAIVAVAAAGILPGHSGAGPDATAETLRSDSAVNADSFQYSYETSNGIRGKCSGVEWSVLHSFVQSINIYIIRNCSFVLKLIAQEAGQLKQIGAEQGIATQGEFSYTAPDGQQYKVTFIADENGFQPQVRKII